MSTKFLLWWRNNGPKGASNSINALLVISLLRDSSEPMSMQQLRSHLGGMSVHSIRSIIDPMHCEGLLKSEIRHHETTTRHRFMVFSIADKLAEVLSR